MEGYRQRGEGRNGVGAACLWVMCTNTQFHVASGEFYTITFATFSSQSIKRELETCFTFREVVCTTRTVCLHDTDCLSSRRRLSVFTTPTVCLHDTDCRMLACLFACCLSNELSVCLCCFLSAFSPNCLLGCLLYKHLYHMLNFIFYLYLLSSSVLYYSS